MKEDTEAGKPSPEEVTELALVVDTQIMKMLGLRFEIQDDIIKVWERDVVPDETNWMFGERFSASLAASAELLEPFKVEVEFFEEDGWHWADVTFGDESYLQTAEAPTKELAGAFAACAVLFGHQKKVSHD
jgi:hypothetical protein